MRIPLVLLTAAGALSLGACATNGYYVGGDVGLAYADPFYDPAACWNSGWYDVGWAGPYCGWYSGFFYPGSGVFVYDRYRHPYRWDRSQQAYWTERVSEWRSQPRTTTVIRQRVVNRIAPAAPAPTMPGARGSHSVWHG